MITSCLKIQQIELKDKKILKLTRNSQIFLITQIKLEILYLSAKAWKVKKIVERIIIKII